MELKEFLSIFKSSFSSIGKARPIDMKIHAYLICYNEEKIIKSVLDYYSKICSKIFLYDNYSSDKSVEIARTYKNVVVNYFDTNGKKDNSLHVKIKTEEYKKYSRKDGVYTEEVADWVICVDMDELIYHPNLKAVLSEYKKMGVTVPFVTGFNMVGENDVVSDISIIDQYRKGVREPVFDKRAIFDPDFDMSYTLGCHSYGAGFELMKLTYKYKGSNKYPIALLHYKHIGSLLYESAHKNLERFNEDAMNKLSNGNYSGPGSHYKFYSDDKFKISPLVKKSKDIFDSVGKVMFDKFPPSVGDKGEVRKEENKASQAVTGPEVDSIRDAAIKLENINLDLSYKLMSIAQKLRPAGPLIQKKVAEYKSNLESNV